jgi:outer membrane protein assembly factor BamB
VISRPAVTDGTVYIGSEDGSVYALNASTGQVQWSHPTGGSVLGSPSVTAGSVYIGSGDGSVYALNAVTRRLCTIAGF